jgi:hypothetical protein
LLESLLPNAPVPPKAKQIGGGTPTVGVSQPGTSSVEIDDPDDEETDEDEGEDDEDVGADVITALTGLKYSRKDATHAVGLAIATANKFLVNDFDYLMRTAIGNLTRVKPATVGNNQAVIARALVKGASLFVLCENLRGIADELRSAFRLAGVAGQIAEIAEGLPKLAANARPAIS